MKDFYTFELVPMSGPGVGSKHKRLQSFLVDSLDFCKAQSLIDGF